MRRPVKPRFSQFLTTAEDRADKVGIRTALGQADGTEAVDEDLNIIVMESRNNTSDLLNLLNNGINTKEVWETSSKEECK